MLLEPYSSLIKTLPSKGTYSPKIHLIKVDLPSPDPPLIRIFSPLLITRSTPFKTVLSP